MKGMKCHPFLNAQAKKTPYQFVGNIKFIEIEKRNCHLMGNLLNSRRSASFDVRLT